MKGVLLSVFLLLSVAASAQWTKLTSYDKYDEMAQEYMDRDDGYTYVINYWATWCGPCVKELPYFEQLLKAYSHDKTRVILVSLDFPKKVDSKLLPFLNKHNIQSEVVILDDPKSNIWIDKVDLSWEGAIPVTIIYRGEKRVFWDGEFDTYEDLDKLFLSIHN